DAEPRTRGGEIVAWASVGAGVAGVAGGVWLLSLHGDGTCDVDSGRRQCPRTWDSQVAGWAAIAAGAAAAGVGLTLWLRAGGDDELRVAAVPTEGGLATTLSFGF